MLRDSPIVSFVRFVGWDQGASGDCRPTMVNTPYQMRWLTHGNSSFAIPVYSRVANTYHPPRAPAQAALLRQSAPP